MCLYIYIYIYISISIFFVGRRPGYVGLCNSGVTTSVDLRDPVPKNAMENHHWVRWFTYEKWVIFPWQTVSQNQRVNHTTLVLLLGRWPMISGKVAWDSWISMAIAIMVYQGNHGVWFLMGVNDFHDELICAMVKRLDECTMFIHPVS